MQLNDVLQVISFARGPLIQNVFMFWADSISGIFLVILAAAVVFEIVLVEKKSEIIKQRSTIAALSMCFFFIIQVIIGRNGIGRIEMVESSAILFVVMGCIAVVFGVILNLIARVQLGRNWSNNIAIYRDQKLVKSGMYGLVRHPLYTTIFLSSIGLALEYQNYISFIFAVAVFLPLLYYRIIEEEKVLIKYIPGYIEYRKTVPMLLPFSVNSFLSNHETKVNYLALVFCRATTVVLLLLAIYFKFVWLVGLGCILMISSAILSIRYAPLVILYSSIFKSFGITKKETVDINAIRFAQGFGSFLLFCALLMFYFFNHVFGGWILVTIVATSTAFGSLGYCLGAYIYFYVRNIYHSYA